MNQSARPFSASLPESESESVSALPVAPQPLDSQQLLQGRRELQILHQGQIYRLQQTRQGKLILTK